MGLPAPGETESDLSERAKKQLLKTSFLLVQRYGLLLAFRLFKFSEEALKNIQQIHEKSKMN